MTEEASTVPDALPSQQPTGVGMTAGAFLRCEREKAGVHIGTLAVSLKVPVKKLQALEADRLDLLPDAVFARALAASVCRTLKLDAGAVLRMLPDQARPRLRIDARISNASFGSPGMGWRLPVLSKLPKPVVVSAAVLLVAALALYLFPLLESSEPPPARPAAAVRKADAPVATDAPVLPAPSAAPATPPPPLRPGSNAAVAVPLGLVQTPAQIVPAAATANPALLNHKTDTPPASAGVVVFTTRGSSWVEVTDASGVVQLRKTISNGETVAASGTLPLSVTVGRADSTEVLVRGKAFDLASVAKDNVARFQIK